MRTPYAFYALSSSSSPFASLRLCVLLLLLATISCAREAPQTQRRETAQQEPVSSTPPPAPPPPAIPALSDSISQQDLRTLLERGRELYWGITSLRSEEKGSIAGFPVVRINPAKAPTMEALRERYRGIFTERAIDTILADFGVIFHEGKLWMTEVDGGDISEYGGVTVISMIPKGGYLLVRMVVPLGEGNGNEERIVRLVHSGKHWLLDSNAYGGEMME